VLWFSYQLPSRLSWIHSVLRVGRTTLDAEVIYHSSEIQHRILDGLPRMLPQEESEVHPRSMNSLLTLVVDLDVTDDIIIGGV
jgi:uncharacterized protein YbaR (Trm112 family)